VCGRVVGLHFFGGERSVPSSQGIFAGEAFGHLPRFHRVVELPPTRTSRGALPHRMRVFHWLLTVVSLALWMAHDAVT
jgi:hypothetical protein